MKFDMVNTVTKSESSKTSEAFVIWFVFFMTSPTMVWNVSESIRRLQNVPILAEEQRFKNMQN